MSRATKATSAVPLAASAVRTGSTARCSRGKSRPSRGRLHAPRLSCPDSSKGPAPPLSAHCSHRSQERGSQVAKSVSGVACAAGGVMAGG
nr:hypothetical protein [Streptomyces sp. SolWspMP-sol7th]